MNSTSKYKKAPRNKYKFRYKKSLSDFRNPKRDERKYDANFPFLRLSFEESYI